MATQGPLFVLVLLFSTSIYYVAEGQVPVQLIFRGVPLSNNSVLSIKDVGEFSNGSAVLCTTDRRPCCLDSDNRFGQWYYPDGTAVPNIGTGEDFYRSRDNNRAIHLNRRNNAQSPTGSFCCELPDSRDVNHTLCVRLVPVQLIFRGVSLPSNSVLSINDVGEYFNGGAVLCTTDRRTCCSTAEGSGDWYYPNGTAVPNFGTGEDFYRGRLDNKTIHLNRRNNTQSPTGSFCCELPDNRDVNHTLCVTLDINECTSGADDCVSGATCVNTVGSFTCTCPSGLTGDGRTSPGTGCTDINECTSGATNDCDTNADCMNTDGSFTCTCRSGYIGDGRTSGTGCTDVDECATGNVTCPSGLMCANTPGSSSCAAMPVTTAKATTAKATTAKATTAKATTAKATTAKATTADTEVPLPETATTTEAPTTTEAASVQSSSLAAVGGGVATVVIALVLVIVAILVGVAVWRWQKQKRLSVGLSAHYATYSVVTFPEAQEKIEEVELAKFELPIDNPHHESTFELSAVELTEFELQVDNPADAGSKDIPVMEFGEHVKLMHSDRDKLFELEYGSLGTTPLASHDVSDIPHNKVRNRFDNIYPYDFSRVKLKELPGVEGSDYINANFLDGYKKPSGYIAAQGPMPNTLTDFWRMIWEYKLPTVVMLTRCYKGRRVCEKYWPETVEESIEPGHNLTVTLTSLLPFADYAIRKMSVIRSSEPDVPPLVVTQFHFLAWPDHGVPSNTMTVINFIRRVRKAHPYFDERHLLVHCSAGVGRTGTFIVLDSMLERMRVERNINIHEFVRQIRFQRVRMVQTQVQYNFIHDALDELITCGETEISAADLRIVVNKRLRCTGAGGITGFQEQFQNLQRVTPKALEADYSVATEEYNVYKNRYQDKLPYEYSRAQLRVTSTPGSDYINASLIDGYRKRGAYIATQGPLKSTVSDFWTMIWDYGSSCIVMLCDLQENGEESCYCYWPTTRDASRSYDEMVVTLVSEEQYEDYTLRKFEVKEHRSDPSLSSSLTVTQFHFLRWSEHSPPQVTSSLLELVENVNKVQMSSGNKAITVMCNDGVGRSGTFICIHSQLERLKTEGVVDFFQAIKSARMQRAGLVPEVAQYQLCHEVLTDFLDSFESYANFEELV